MMRIFATLFTIIILSLGQSLYAEGPFYSKPFKPAEELKDQFITDKSIAYVIYQQGKELSPGKFEPGRYYPIKKVDKRFYLQGSIYIKTKTNTDIGKHNKGINSDIIQSAIEGLRIKNIRKPFELGGTLQLADKYGVGRILELVYESPIDPYDVCKSLMDNPEIEYAVPVFIHERNEFTPNDPKLSSQWAVNKIQLPKAWDVTKGDKKILIAIVDSGIDYEHEDLLGNIWTNQKETAGNEKDDDSNGKIDDIRGWDFVGDISAQEAVNQQWEEDNNPKSNNTNNNHGTHTSGCASSVTNNAKGIAGTGFNCSIIPIKCGADDGSIWSIFRGYEAILYAAKLGAQIINCSWGGPGDSPVGQDIINQANALGSLVVVSAGNDYSSLDIENFYPANYTGVVCIGATGTNDKKSGFSNWGHAVTVYSPGENIYSTMPGNKYEGQSGTSMSAPIASGVAGLIKAVFPNFTNSQIKAQLRSTSDNVLISDPNLRPQYYGRVNAYKAVTYNNPSYPAFKVPGIAFTDFTITGGNAIKDYKSTYIDLTVKNHLADIGDLVVKISSLDKFVEVSTSLVSVGILKTGEQRMISFDIKLLPTNPWHTGYVRLLLTYESAGYTDYELIKIPIKIPSDNQYGDLYEFPDWLEPEWRSAHSPSDGVLWVGGATSFGASSFRYGGAGGTRFDILGNDQVFAVYSFDDKTALMGTGTSGTDGNALIYMTSDGGNNWSYSNLGSVTGFINGIHFFDGQEGLIFGDPKNGKWGLARSKDKGKSWSSFSGIPVPQTNESGFAGSFFASGDNCWFGTNKGRIFRSANKGYNWAASVVFNGGHIFRMGFIDGSDGIAIYSEVTNQTSPKLVAATNDGGQTWRLKQFDFTSLGIDPIYVFSPPRTKAIVVLCAGGQVFMTKDLGKTWTPILSKQSIGAWAGAVNYGDEFYNKLYLADVQFSYLQFQLVPDDVKKELILVSDTVTNFDTLDIGTNKTENVELKNTGEIEIKLFQSTIIPVGDTEADEFSFYLPPPQTIPVDKTQRIKIKFAPVKQGERRATLKFQSSSSLGEITVNLVGYGRKPVSVENESENVSGFRIFPNPSDGKISLLADGNMKDYYTCEIYDIYGKRLTSIILSPDESGILPTELTSGVYFLRIIGEGGTSSLPFVINK